MNREALENDRAALAVLLRLAETGNTYSIEGEGANLETAIRDAFEDGAGAVEPSAVVAWVKGEIARLDNTLDALDGAMGHDCQCGTCGARMNDSWAVALVQEAVNYESEAFDGDDDVNGGDLVEWFGEWRHRAQAAL